MKKSLLLATIVSSLLITGAASAAKTNFKADLDPGNENDPATDTTGGDPKGTVEATYDDVTKELCGKITWTGLTGVPSGIHVHQSPPGDPFADGVAPAQTKLLINTAGLTANGNVSFNFKLTPAFETSLNAEDQNFTAREIYINIHTTKNPNGEARGSLEEGGNAVVCGAATNPDGGVSSSTSSSGDPDSGSTSSSTSSSSGSTTSSASSSGSTGTTSSASSSSGKSAPDAGEDEAAAPADSGGCNVVGSPIDAASLFLVGGAALGVIARLRNKKRKSSSK